MISLIHELMNSLISSLIGECCAQPALVHYILFGKNELTTHQFRFKLSKTRSSERHGLSGLAGLVGLARLAELPGCWAGLGWLWLMAAQRLLSSGCWLMAGWVAGSLAAGWEPKAEVICPGGGTPRSGPKKQYRNMWQEAVRLQAGRIVRL